MFGRHLKKEYKRQWCTIYAEDDIKPIGQRYTSINDPILNICSVSFFMFGITVLIIYKVLPLLNLNLHDTLCNIILWTVVTAGLFIGYNMVSESDYKDDVESLN